MIHERTNKPVVLMPRASRLPGTAAPASRPPAHRYITDDDGISNIDLGACAMNDDEPLQYCLIFLYLVNSAAICCPRISADATSSHKCHHCTRRERDCSVDCCPWVHIGAWNILDGKTVEKRSSSCDSCRGSGIGVSERNTGSWCCNSCERLASTWTAGPKGAGFDPFTLVQDPDHQVLIISPHHHTRLMLWFVDD